MTEVVVFPDVEKLLVDHLGTTLPDYGWDVPVSTKVPNPRPVEFVRLFVTGGTRRDIVTDRPTVVVEAWAQVERLALDLAEMCRGIIYAIDVIGGTQFYYCETASRPQNLPDPDTHQVRYSATYSLQYRGAAIE